MKERISRIIVLCLAVCLLATSCDLKISDTPVTDVVEQESFYTISYFSDKDETEPYLVDKSLYLIQPGTYPHKEGFYVSGWSLAGKEELVTAWGTELSGNISLYPIWVEDVTSYRFEGTGTEADPFLIDEAEDLVYLASLVNDGNSFDGKYLKVVNDIDMSAETEWTPIGTFYSPDQDLSPIPVSDVELPFRGVFDGDNHTITLPTVDYQNWKMEESFGLFGLVSGENAVIKNLKIGGKINVSSSSAGLLAGILSGGATVENCQTTEESVVKGLEIGGFFGRVRGSSNLIKCTNYAEVVTTSDVSGSGKAGGIASCIYYPENTGAVSHFVIECQNFGNVTGVDYTGGIAGIAAGTEFRNCSNGSSTVRPVIRASKTTIGGIAGRGIDNSVFNSCLNYGTIEIDDASVSAESIGGITGYLAGTVDDCQNLGKIVVKTDATDLTKISTIGGIVGSTWPDSQILNSENHSPLDSWPQTVIVESVGGIAGYGSKGNLEIAGCNNYGKIEGANGIAGILGGTTNPATDILIDRCLNKGEIKQVGKSTSNSTYAAGIVATARPSASLTIKNTENRGSVITDDLLYVGGIAGWVYSPETRIENVTNGVENNGEDKHVSGSATVGGLISNLQKTGTEPTAILKNVKNHMTVSTSGNATAGGLIGISSALKELAEGLNTGSVSADNGNAGGLIGSISSSGEGTVVISSSNNSGAASGNTAGGLINTVSKASSVSVSECENAGEVKSKTHAGGIFAKVDGFASVTSSHNTSAVKSESTYAGGFAGTIGTSGELNVSGSSNSGSVEGKNTVGGIIGNLNGKTKIESVENSGTVSSTAETGQARAGGMIGFIYGTSAEIVKSKNSGEISGAGSYIGGFVGFAVDKGRLTIKNSLNSGSVSSKSTAVGGFAGTISISCELSECSNTGKISAAESAGGIAGTITSTKDVVLSSLKSENCNITSDGALAGGLFSSLKITTADFAIRDSSVNNTTVKGTNYVGGLVGNLSCNADENLTLELNNCSTEKVDINYTPSLSGGFAIGRVQNLSSVSFTQCDINGTTTDFSSVVGNAGTTQIN